MATSNTSNISSERRRKENAKQRSMDWSAENATNAFLRTIRSGNKAMDPDVPEFISAMAAGSGARLMVEVCGESAGPTTLALISAAQQTGGRVVCIVRGPDEVAASVEALGKEADLVELVAGDAKSLLRSSYKGVDFVLVDCELDQHEGVLRAVKAGAMEETGGVVVGYNALSQSSVAARRRESGQLKVTLLPIGGGLSVCRVPPACKRSQWVVRVDECTGEEHVFRISSPRRRSIEA